MNIGDVVMFKNGGPLMTILEVSYSQEEGEQIVVGWFDKFNQLQKCGVDSHVIVKADATYHAKTNAKTCSKEGCC